MSRRIRRSPGALEVRAAMLCSLQASRRCGWPVIVSIARVAMHRRSALHHPRPIDARAALTSPVAPARPKTAPATELRRPFGIDCSILVPPYDALAPLPSTDRGALAPPLGPIVHASAPPVLGALATLTITVRRFPWVAPCIAVAPDDEWLEPCIGLVSELGDRLALVQSGGRAARVLASAIGEAVRRRPPPRAAAMADYVSRRLAHPELLAPLSHQFEQALEGVPATTSASIATYSRLFARYGRFSPRHWRALARPGPALASPAPGRREAVARRLGRKRTP